MKTDKIKKYTLGILATVGVLFLILLVVIIAIEISPRNRFTEPTQGLIADEKAETLKQENLRKQIISYDSPWLIDTLNTIYIIPVSIKTLKKPEEIKVDPLYEEMPSFDSYGYNYSKRGYYSSKKFDGKYANLIIYHPKEGNTKSLFSERLIIGNVQTYHFKDDILMIFYTATKDTDKNGIIDLDDLRSLCIYSMKEGSLKKISDGENQTGDYTFIESSKDLLVEFFLGQYVEKQFDNHQRPGKVMKYSYDTETLTDIIPANIQQEMQGLVEGK